MRTSTIAICTAVLLSSACAAPTRQYEFHPPGDTIKGFSIVRAPHGVVQEKCKTKAGKPVGGCTFIEERVAWVSDMSPASILHELCHLVFGDAFHALECKETYWNVEDRDEEQKSPRYWEEP